MRTKKKTRIILYFTVWLVFAAICVVLNVINIDWNKTGTIGGIFVVITLAILQGSVLEFPLQAILTLLVGGKTRNNKRAPCDYLTVMLNYNLLATSKEEVNDCMKNMYKAYVGNLSPNVSTVLVSSTDNEELKRYEIEVRDRFRKLLYDELYFEGIAFSRGDYTEIDPIHFKNIWEEYLPVDKEIFLTKILHNVCVKLTKNFMVLHRVSRVLRKCGQYQDLMLLSEGIKEAFSYCDRRFHGKLARTFGEPLFYFNEDVNNICGRKFDYTLVLDSDTRVTRGIVFDILQIAAAHPKRAIIQPAIKLHCTENDSLFMHLECIRQSIFEPMTNASMALLQQCSFYGKGLIKNKLYIEVIIGTRERPIERVPVNVLSHDTFEAAILKPLYAGSVFLLEEPCHNFVTWNMRERRWNIGEVITAMYIWNHAFGIPMRCLQRLFQRSRYNNVRLRTETKLDFVTSHIAHSAFRHMLLKPVLVVYILCHILFKVIFKNVYISISIVMFLILIFPKIATCTRHNYKFVIIETISSIFQFTPEVIVGTVRLFRAICANITLNTKWIPQRAIENKFKTQNRLWLSIKELWGYSLFALVLTILIIFFHQHSILALILTSVLFILPLFSGFTALPLSKFKCNKELKAKHITGKNNQNSNSKKKPHRHFIFEGSFSSFLHSRYRYPLDYVRPQVKRQLQAKQNLEKSRAYRLGSHQILPYKRIENLNVNNLLRLPLTNKFSNYRKCILSGVRASPPEYSLYNGNCIRNVNLFSLARSFPTIVNINVNLNHLTDNTYEFGKKTLVLSSSKEQFLQRKGNGFESNYAADEIGLQRYKKQPMNVDQMYASSPNAEKSLNSHISVNKKKTNASRLRPYATSNFDVHNIRGLVEHNKVMKEPFLLQHEPRRDTIHHAHLETGSSRIFNKYCMLY